MHSSEESRGYVTDASYPDKFFRELSPTWLNYVAALNGAEPRDLSRPFRYLELGCAFAHSTIANAGAFPHAEFHGCDFNPEHIEGARRHAAVFGVGNLQLHCTSFEELCARDLPSFDYIVLHGVYSWVDAATRRAIRRVIRDKLERGGLVYVSYNCLPGWSSEAPLRRLLVELAATAAGDSAERSRQALQSLKALANGRLRYFGANPDAKIAIDAYLKGPSNYLAHEFLNRAWEPFYSIDVAEELAEAELDYLGSATLADNHQPLLVDAEVAAAVAGLRSPRQRELAFDFAVNRRFRRDVFVRGEQRLDSTQIARHLHAVAIGCLGDPERIGFTARVPRGEIRFGQDFVGELRGLLARGSWTLADAVAALGGGDRDPAEIARNLIYLVAAGELSPFAQARQIDPARRPERFAVAAMPRALAYVVEQNAPRALPSAVLGNGVEIGPTDAAGVLEYFAGGSSAALASHVLPSLLRLGLVE